MHHGVMETPAHAVATTPAHVVPETPAAPTPWRTPIGPNTHHVVVDSPIEELTLVSDGAALTGVYMAVHRHTDRTGSRHGSAGSPPRVAGSSPTS